MRTVSSLSLKAFGLILFIFVIGCSSAPKTDAPASSEPLSPASRLSPSQSPMENPEPSTAQPEAPSSSARSYFDWPVDEARMSRGYLTNRRKPHLGLDLAARKGTNIYASHDGLVIYVGRGFHGYGRMIMIEGKDNFATIYAHLSKFIAKQGSRVNQGDLIGLMGRTGHATGNHLHFEIRVGNQTVNPLHYLPKALKQ